MAVLTDELLLSILHLLDAKDLSVLVRVSRACYVLGHTDELWRALVLATNKVEWRHDVARSHATLSWPPLSKGSRY